MEILNILTGIVDIPAKVLISARNDRLQREIARDNNRAILLGAGMIATAILGVGVIVSFFNRRG